MYCRHCGKKLPDNYDDLLCEDCKWLERQPFAEFEQPQSNAQPQDTENNRQQQTIGNNYNYYDGRQNNASYSEKPQTNSRMLGFGPALTSTILGYFGLCFSFYAIVYGSAASGSYSSAYEHTSSVGAFICFLILTLGLSIPAFIFGIKSIKLASSIKSRGGATPIATLVLGIIGTVFSGLALAITTFTLLATIL